VRRARKELSMLILPVLPFPAINPVLISIGPLAVRWYALAYIVGIIAGWLYARAIIASQRLWGGPAPITVAAFDDFIIWITLGIILGGRTGYVLFYNFPHFAAHPIEIFELWNGGMSFHGGVLGCIVATILFALRRGLPMLSLGDITTAVGSDRTLPRPHRKFHQRRIVGPAGQCTVGDGIPQWRTDPAPSQPALRGGARRPCSSGRARRAGALGRAQAARSCYRRVRARLWRRAHCLRIFPRARRAAWFSLGRAHDGDIALYSIHSGGHRRARLRA
jgi:hypothetical protein